MPTRPPVVLTVAGSDNSCGAGLQADLKTITACGGYALTAATCVVAEVPGLVGRIAPVPSAVVREQILLAFRAFPVRSIKTGMLFSSGLIEAVVGALLEGSSSSRQRPPALVVDPVMAASSGEPLLKETAIRSYCSRLIPLATLVTPNLHELAILAGEKEIRNFDEMRECGIALARRFDTAFLLKGGNLRGTRAVDLLVGPDGRQQEFSAPFVKGVDPHGTGCTYSSAIATGLANDLPLPEAVARAKRFITAAIKSRYRWGATEALNHSVSPV